MCICTEWKLLPRLFCDVLRLDSKFMVMNSCLSLKSGSVNWAVIYLYILFDITVKLCVTALYVIWQNCLQILWNINMKHDPSKKSPPLRLLVCNQEFYGTITFQYFHVQILLVVSWVRINLTFVNYMLHFTIPMLVTPVH